MTPSVFDARAKAPLTREPINGIVSTPLGGKESTMQEKKKSRSVPQFGFTTISVHRETALEVHKLAIELDLYKHDVMRRAVSAYRAQLALEADAFKTPRVEVRA
jgi:hypothetical protein